MLDSTLAVIKFIGKEERFINFALEITPHVIVSATAGVPIVNDISIFASRDPVMIDTASVDTINKVSIIPGSAILGKKNKLRKKIEDVFHTLREID